MESYPPTKSTCCDSDHLSYICTGCVHIRKLLRIQNTIIYTSHNPASFEFVIKSKQPKKLCSIADLLGEAPTKFKRLRKGQYKFIYEFHLSNLPSGPVKYFRKRQ